MAELESQLQTFDAFFDILSPEARSRIAALVHHAAEKTHDDAARERIEAAAQSVAAGNRAAAPDDHEAAMREYRAAYEANFEKQPEPPAPVVLQEPAQEPCRTGGSSKVEHRQYQTAIQLGLLRQHIGDASTTEIRRLAPFLRSPA